MKKKKGNDVTVFWILLLSVVVIFSILFSFMAMSKDKFVIYKEECWNESVKSEWYELDGFDRVSSRYLGNELRNYEVRATYFNSWEYVEEVICMNVFKEKGLYPDYINGFQSLATYQFPIKISNRNQEFYDGKFSIDGFTCEGIFYIEKEGYSQEEKERVMLNNIYVNIPDFNKYKVYLKEWGEEFDNEVELRNDNKYWDIEFRIIYPEKEVCERVEVDEIVDSLYISKQEISILWLDENCECLDYCKKCGLFGEGICCPANEEIQKESYPCSEYKCGDYFVEVK